MSELICSEVHTFTHELSNEKSIRKLSRFSFSIPSNLGVNWTTLNLTSSELEFNGIRRSRSIPADVGEDSGNEDIEVPRFTSLDSRGLDNDEVGYDSDGDLDLPRRGSKKELQLVIEHEMATELCEVGLQVWKGSLVLADFLICNHIEFQDKNILEVGSGTALASIVGSLCGANVIATDVGERGILELMRKNIARNEEVLKSAIKVRELDFKSDIYSSDELINIDYVIAGDIIYDDQITSHFLNFLAKLLKIVRTKSLKILVSLEKRFVFTVADLDTVAPAYDYFLTHLEHFKDDNATHRVSVNEICLDFPQHFCYERSLEMVMLEIVCVLK